MGPGDVFIADTGHNRVLLEKPNGSGGYTQSVVDSAGLSGPQGVAVDRYGEVFIADSGNRRMVLDKPNGLGGYTQSVVGVYASSASGLAVDASRDVFIADTKTNRVYEYAVGAPSANFSDTQSAVSFTVAFTDVSTAVSPATITGWSCNFGDGSPVSTQQNPSHTYASPGSFGVTLTVTESTGQTSTVGQGILVEPGACVADLPDGRAV
jgi:hypothetical protein